MAEVRLARALLTGLTDHDIQRKLNTPNFVQISPTIVTRPSEHRPRRIGGHTEALDHQLNSTPLELAGVIN